MIHPLDPLTKDEIAAAAAIARKEGGLSPRAWFETIALTNPRSSS
jgi:Cu2+-containing amine oxidase